MGRRGPPQLPPVTVIPASGPLVLDQLVGDGIAQGHPAQGGRRGALVSDVITPNPTGIERIEELLRIAPHPARRRIFLSGGVFTAQTRERLDQIGAPRLAGEVNLPAM